MPMSSTGDPKELRRLVDALKAGQPFMSLDADAFRSAPFVAIRELRDELERKERSDAA